MNKPKVLIWDVETSPITGYVWNLYDQNLGLNQIKQDWCILAWAAKWNDESKVMYEDNSKNKDVYNDKRIITKLHKLLDSADIVITQNGDRFDIKKFNARAIVHGLPPLHPFKSTDTLKESKKVFGFTSHSLEYMSNLINTKYKKLKHKKYPGFELWKEVLKGNKDAWREMKTYCIHDVLATDEYYNKVHGWIKTQNMSVFFDDVKVRCRCGSKNVIKRGLVYVDRGVYQGYECKDCGKRPKGSVNLLSKEKRSSLLKEGK